jgi:hypothetical protein
LSDTEVHRHSLKSLRVRTESDLKLLTVDWDTNLREGEREGEEREERRSNDRR